MKVINFCGGPGCGKSTAAAGLFNIMKSNHFRVEIVTEFAKELTYLGDNVTLSNQLTVLGEQDRRISCLQGHADYVITDSPLFLSLVYAQGDYRQDWFRTACLGAFERYDNYVVYVDRVVPYSTMGRSQTEKESLQIDEIILGLLAENGIEHIVVPGDNNAPQAVFEMLTNQPGLTPA